MRLDYVSTNKSSLEKFLAIDEMTGEVIEFELGNFSKTKPEDYVGTFDEINLYMSILHQDVKTQLFQLYKEARRVLDNTLPNPKQLIPALLPVITQMYNVFDLEQFSLFNRNKKIIEIPGDLSGDEDAFYPVATTYNESEYYHLVEYAIAVHLLSPIAMEFVKRIKNVTGNDFKELSAYPLLANTPIAAMDGWKKLKAYTEAQCARTPVGLAPSLEGLSPQTYIQYLITQTVIRRLCINKTQYTGKNKKKNLVNVVYGTVKRSGNSGNIGALIRNKDPKRFRSEDEKDPAFTEMYKMKQEVLESDIVMTEEVFLFELFDENNKPRPHNRFKISSAIFHPELDPALVAACFDNIPSGWNYNLMTHSLILMQTVLGSKVSPGAIIDFSYAGLCSAMAHAQAELIRRGFEYLPVLVTSIIATDDDGPRAEYGESMELTGDEKNALISRYKITVPPHDGRSSNIGVKSMELFLRSVKTHSLVSPLRSPFAEILSGGNTGKLYPVEINGAVKKEMLALVLGENK